MEIIYSHSYDRGLQSVLEIGWPIIKKYFPSARLHVAYGWVLFDKVHKNNPERIAWKTKIEKLMAQDGIVHHGRISQKELLNLKKTCAVNFYPTHFEEIDCVGVRESAAVGCIPFTTDYAALKGRAYCVTTPGNPLKRETQEAVANNVVKYLNGELDIDVEKFKRLARKESWPNISELWLKEIN